VKLKLKSSLLLLKSSTAWPLWHLVKVCTTLSSHQVYIILKLRVSVTHTTTASPTHLCGLSTIQKGLCGRLVLVSQTYCITTAVCSSLQSTGFWLTIYLGFLKANQQWTGPKSETYSHCEGTWTGQHWLGCEHPTSKTQIHDTTQVTKVKGQIPRLPVEMLIET